MLPEAIKIFKQSLLGTTMPMQLYDDKELIKAAEREHRASKVGKPMGEFRQGEEFCRQISAIGFRDWMPEYFDSSAGRTWPRRTATSIKPTGLSIRRRQLPGRVPKGDARSDEDEGP